MIFVSPFRVCVFLALSRLRALHTLNVSGTEFNRHGLEMVVEDLPQLESLDISCTRVDDITPLKKCKDRLKTLSMYNLKISGYGNLKSVLLELNELRTLDISDEKDSYTFEMFAPVRTKINDLLQAVHCMPHLTSLDISGCCSLRAIILDCPFRENLFDLFIFISSMYNTVIYTKLNNDNHTK